jgi:OFA family oxalate/formate antiporter-like MFS transporter
LCNNRIEALAAAWVVPLTSLLKNCTGHWYLVFVIATTMNLVVAALALFMLKPMRRRLVSSTTY